MHIGDVDGEVFWHALERHGGATALIAPDGTEVGYDDLAERAEAWSKRFRDALPDLARPLIALQMAPLVETVAAYLGALRAGHVVLLCDGAAMAEDHPIRRIYRPNLDLVPDGSGGAALSVLDREAADMHPELRLLLSTSGTTGAPKLVRLSEQNLAANARSIATYLGLGPDERAITTLPMHYSYGMSVLHAHMAAGASLVLTEDSVVDDAFWDTFRRTGATSLALVPHQFDLLDGIGFAGMDLPTLRYVTQAGGKLAEPKVRRFHDLGRRRGWRLVVMYGQTEAAPRISYIPPEDLAGNYGTIGRAIPGGELWLADEDGAAIEAAGRPGELVYEGPNVMLGYAESRADLSRPAEPKVLKTGDIAERTPTGFFRIVGRKKRFVKLYGLRLSLDHMEAELAEAGLSGYCLNVDDRLVVLHQDPDAGERVARHLAGAYDLPLDAVLTAPLGETPLMSSGKVDYRALQDRAREVRDREAATGDPEDQSLREVIARATRSTEVRDDDTFSSLGGDSLSYLQVSMTLEERLGYVPQGWERMPVAELEAAPRGDRGGSRIEASVIARILAVSLIVAGHLTWWPTSGGTWILFAITGFSLARFGRGTVEAGRPGKLVFQMLYPIVPLYFIIMIGVMTYGMRFSPEMLTLTANLVPVLWGDLVTPNWFVSAYVQITLICVGLMALPRVRRAVGRDPWAAGMVAFCLTLAVSAVEIYGFTPALDAADIGRVWSPGFRLPFLPDPGVETDWRLWVPILRQPQTILPAVFLGWCIFCAEGARRRALTAAGAVAVLLVFPAPRPDYYVVMGTLYALLLSGISVVVPRRAATILRAAATTTLFVYLLHGIPVYVIRFKSPIYDKIGAIPSLVIVLIGTFVAAWIAKRLFDLADGVAVDLWGRIRGRGRTASA